MKALVFAAGRGSRLKPWTDSHPKALAPVGGIPMLGRVIKKLTDAGITDIVVNVHHFAGQIADYLNTTDFNARITLSDESSLLLDTGGGLLKAAHLLADSGQILVHNADIFTDFDISEMSRFAADSQAMACLLAKERETQRYLAFDSSGKMRGWTNIATGQVRPAANADIISRCNLRAFGGVHIVDESIFKALAEYNASLLEKTPDRDTSDGICKFSITDFYIDNCGKYLFKAFEPACAYRWIDIGKAENLLQAETLVAAAGK